MSKYRERFYELWNSGALMSETGEHEHEEMVHEANTNIEKLHTSIKFRGFYCLFQALRYCKVEGI